MSSKHSYEILTSEDDFVRYLDKMGKLPVKFVDTRRNNRELGNGLVPLRMYLPQGENKLEVVNNEARLHIAG